MSQSSFKSEFMEAEQDSPRSVIGSEPLGSTIPPSQRPALIGLVAGAAVVVLDFFIVLACLPSIEATLGATRAQLQLVMAAYAIANGSCLILGGRLGDVLGRKRVFMVSLGAFALASAACGLATSAFMLILFRVLQGVAGAMLQPQVLGLLAVNFRNAARPRVFGLYGAAMGMAGIAAQIVGGSMVELMPIQFGWRACFLLSLPLCALAAHFAASAVEGERSKSREIDFVGALLLAVTLGCACAFLTIGREHGWPIPSWIVFASGALGALLFGGWLAIGRAFGAQRIIPAGMLAANGFGFALVTILVFYCGVASLYFVLALELRDAAGFSPIQAGLAFAWLGLCFAVASSSKRLKAAIGPRWVVAGMSVLLCGHLAMALAALQLSGVPRVLAYVLGCGLQGTGIGLLMAPLIAIAVSRVSSDLVSIGGGIVAATQQVGNSLGICVIGFAYFGSAETSSRFTGAGGAVAYLVVMLGLLALLMRSGSVRRR